MFHERGKYMSRRLSLSMGIVQDHHRYIQVLDCRPSMYFSPATVTTDNVEKSGLPQWDPRKCCRSVNDLGKFAAGKHAQGRGVDE
jgi:hypothetical protein